MEENKKITVATFRQLKEKKEKISLLTAYDFITGRLVDEAGVEGVLVGDSLGNTVLGYANTIPVTMAEMVHHTKAVARAIKRALIIGDMPFMSYQAGPSEALKNAAAFVKEAGAEAVKLEGAEFIDEIKTIIKAGIPVMGHLGFTPQSVNQIGGYKIQGKTPEARQILKQQAQALEDAGVFALVLEMVPADLAGEISQMLKIPTIGCGAGPYCDGQVLVISDLLGLNKAVPKHAKVFAPVGEQISQAVKNFIGEIKNGKFPESPKDQGPSTQG